MMQSPLTANFRWEISVLTIFYGTSGVGKTEVMRQLFHNFGWRFVTTFTTRARRDDDVGTVSVSENEFTSRIDVILKNAHFGQWYGKLEGDISCACDKLRDEFWMTDFSILNHEQLLQYNCKFIMIMPQDRQQLLRQVLLAGRIERISDILFEYETYSSSEGRARLASMSISSFINPYMDIISLACQINSLSREGWKNVPA